MLLFELDFRMEKITINAILITKKHFYVPIFQLLVNFFALLKTHIWLRFLRNEKWNNRLHLRFLAV